MSFKPVLQYLRVTPESYPSSYSGSYQTWGGINYLKFCYFTTKTSRIEHFGLGRCDTELMRYYFNVQSLVK